MSCSCCGKCGCECGSLPYTFTVGFSGLTTKTHGNYCDLTITSNYGGGAAGVATAPGGCNGEQDPECRQIGSGCEDGEATYDASNRGPLAGVLLTEAGGCYAKYGRVEPTISVFASPGEGATFKASLSQNQDDDGCDYWVVSSISVKGGKGYEDNSSLTIRHAVGDHVETAAKATLFATAIVTDPDTGEISGGEPLSVQVTSGGKYWREDLDATPYVADIKVTPCGGGTGAAITAKVDTDTKSKTFGQVTGLTIANGGTDYLAWGWVSTCLDKQANRTFVLRADSPEPLVALCAKSCYGSGATAEIVALGSRSEPTVKLSGSGTKGSLSATLSRTDEDGNTYRPYWSISSVSAGGGSNYVDGEAASISLTPCGAVAIEAASITLAATPIVVDETTGKTSGGSLTGATVVAGGKYYLEADYDGAPTPIKHATLGRGGGGYAKHGRESPTLSVHTETGSPGSGATFTPTLASKKDGCGLDYWYVTKVTASGGSGYEQGQPLAVKTAGGDTTDVPAVLFVVTKQPVDKQPPGQIESITISDGGRYWRENKSLPPYVTKVTFEPDQAAGSAGKDAVIAGVVDANTSSDKFGQVTKVKIENHGTGYTLFGRSVSCTYSGSCINENCTTGPSPSLRFRGRNKEPEVTLGDAIFRSPDAVADCRSLPTSAAALHSTSGGSVTITPGGLYSRGQCDACKCTGTCTCDGDCGPGCTCVNGQCVQVPGPGCACLLPAVAAFVNGVLEVESTTDGSSEFTYGPPDWPDCEESRNSPCYDNRYWTLSGPSTLAWSYTWKVETARYFEGERWERAFEIQESSEAGEGCQIYPTRQYIKRTGKNLWADGTTQADFQWSLEWTLEDGIEEPQFSGNSADAPINRDLVIYSVYGFEIGQQIIDNGGALPNEPFFPYRFPEPWMYPVRLITCPPPDTEEPDGGGGGNPLP